MYKKQNPNKRRTLITENLSKCGLVDGPRDGPPWSRRDVMPLSSYTLQILLLLSSLPSTNRYDGSFKARRSFEGFRSITLKLLGICILDYFQIITTNQQDEPSWLWRSVMKFVVLQLGQTFPSSFSCLTTMPPMDRHKLDGPSQAL